MPKPPREIWPAFDDDGEELEEDEDDSPLKKLLRDDEPPDRPWPLPEEDVPRDAQLTG